MLIYLFLYSGGFRYIQWSWGITKQTWILNVKKCHFRWATLTLTLTVWAGHRLTMSDMWVTHHCPKAVSWHSTPHKYQCCENPHTSVVDVYDDQSLFAWLFFLPVLALLLVFPQQSGALWCCLEDAPAYIADDWCSVKISDVEILGSVIAIGDCEIDLGPIG